MYNRDKNKKHHAKALEKLSRLEIRQDDIQDKWLQEINDAISRRSNKKPLVVYDRQKVFKILEPARHDTPKGYQILNLENGKRIAAKAVKRMSATATEVSYSKSGKGKKKSGKTGGRSSGPGRY